MALRLWIIMSSLKLHVSFVVCSLYILMLHQVMICLMDICCSIKEKNVTAVLKKKMSLVCSFFFFFCLHACAQFYYKNLTRHTSSKWLPASNKISIQVVPIIYAPLRCHSKGFVSIYFFNCTQTCTSLLLHLTSQQGKVSKRMCKTHH